jgi:hypothetical protein
MTAPGGPIPEGDGGADQGAGHPVASLPQSGGWSRADTPPRCQPTGGWSRRGVGKDAKESGQGTWPDTRWRSTEVSGWTETDRKTSPRQRARRAGSSGSAL